MVVVGGGEEGRGRGGNRGGEGNRGAGWGGVGCVCEGRRGRGREGREGGGGERREAGWVLGWVGRRSGRGGGPDD